MQCISRAPLASRAAAYEHLGNHAAAIAGYNAALRLDSRFAIADFRRAATLYDAQGAAIMVRDINPFATNVTINALALGV